jgi:GH18 family chitinase
MHFWPERPLSGSRSFAILLALTAISLGLSGCAQYVVNPSAIAGQSPAPRLVGYLPDYHSSYATYAQTLNFAGITHLILAFGHAPACSGVCTSGSDMTISLRQSDAEIAAIVGAAHNAGVKVLVSLGGGDSAGDQTFSQFYNVGLSKQLAASVDQFVTAHNLDGVDVDIEDEANMGAPLGDFVTSLAAQLHPENKLLTGAVAVYRQPFMTDATLDQFDFLNVTSFSSPGQAESDLQYYAKTKSIAADKIVLGVPFFGTNSSQTVLASYSAILAAYPDAWQTDQVSGGALDNGAALDYVGETSMTQETQLGVKYGGVMVWELTQDAAAPHSLLDIIRKNL